MPAAGLVVKTLLDENTVFCLENNISQICPRAGDIAPAAVKHAQHPGLAVRAWGVSGICGIKFQADSGAGGEAVNFPDKLILCINGVDG